jgi:hypothetical protein
MLHGPSLYDAADLEVTSTPEPRPEPGTSLTASVETIDNDRAGGFALAAGIVR